jgi:hypothetical protein
MLPELMHKYLDMEKLPDATPGCRRPPWQGGLQGVV